MATQSDASLLLETVGKTEDETAKAVKARDRTRESAYGESKQKRTMEDQPHQYRPTGDVG